MNDEYGRERVEDVELEVDIHVNNSQIHDLEKIADMDAEASGREEDYQDGELNLGSIRLSED